jgi:hypothetical protein
MLAAWATPLITAASGLAGVLIGAWTVARRDRNERRFHFIRQQVDEFYAPLVGIRREILAKSELRVRIGAAAGPLWAEMCEGKSADELRALQGAEFWKFEQLVKYNNEQLEKELLPSYRQMLATFREKAALAEDSTKHYYQQLVDFVDIWNRSLNAPLPPGLAERLGHGEESLHPLYSNLEYHLKELRWKLERGGESILQRLRAWRRQRRT